MTAPNRRTEISASIIRSSPWPSSAMFRKLAVTLCVERPVGINPLPKPDEPRWSSRSKDFHIGHFRINRCWSCISFGVACATHYSGGRDEWCRPLLFVGAAFRHPGCKLQLLPSNSPQNVQGNHRLPLLERSTKRPFFFLPSRHIA